jgi:hypothetical protein
MTQIQLSDAQSVILSTACARDDGAVFPVTTTLKGGAVGNVCKSLLKHRLIEEIEATDLNTVWRHDEERGPITLRATPLAYTALGIADETSEAVRAETATAPEPVKRRSGTKQQVMIDMLSRPDGATIEEIADITGWRSHTIRGSMSGALKKKLGLTITSEKVDGRGRVYNITC